LPHFVCVCVGEIISLPWFSNELKNDLSKNNCFYGVLLILLVRESIFVGWGSLFPIVLVPRYKLSLCHTPIKPDLLGFPGISVFAWSRGSRHLVSELGSISQVISFCNFHSCCFRKKKKKKSPWCPISSSLQFLQHIKK